MNQLYQSSIVLFFALNLCVSSARGDIIVNGGFELGSSGTLKQGQVIRGGSLPGWVVDIVLGSNPQDFNVDLTAAGSWNHFEGQRSLDLEGSFSPGGTLQSGTLSGSISQIVASTIGQTYDLSFALGGNYFLNGTEPRQMEVLWNDSSLGVFQHSLASDESWNSFTWDTHSLPISGNLVLGNDKLTFRSITPAVDGHGAVLDSVSLTAVPEPSSGILLFASSIAAMLVRRRRKGKGRKGKGDAAH